MFLAAFFVLAETDGTQHRIDALVRKALKKNSELIQIIKNVYS